MSRTYKDRNIFKVGNLLLNRKAKQPPKLPKQKEYYFVLRPNIQRLFDKYKVSYQFNADDTMTIKYSKNFENKYKQVFNKLKDNFIKDLPSENNKRNKQIRYTKTAMIPSYYVNSNTVIKCKLYSTTNLADLTEYNITLITEYLEDEVITRRKDIEDIYKPRTKYNWFEEGFIEVLCTKKDRLLKPKAIPFNKKEIYADYLHDKFLNTL
jgi:hypothetical protein